MKNRVRLRDLVYRHRLEVRMRLHAELRERLEPLGPAVHRAPSEPAAAEADRSPLSPYEEKP